MLASGCRRSGGRGGVRRRTPSSTRRQQHINRYQLQLTYDSSNVTVSPFADIMINRLPTAPTNPSTTRLSIAQPAVNRLSATDSTTNHTSAYSTAHTTTTVAPTTSTSCSPPSPSMDVYDKWVWRRTIDDVCTSSIEPSDAPCQQDDAVCGSICCSASVAGDEYDSSTKR
jgi:hypothetical protein